MKTPIVLWLAQPTPCRRWEPIAFLILALVLAVISLAVINNQQEQIEILHESAWAWFGEAVAR